MSLILLEYTSRRLPWKPLMICAVVACTACGVTRLFAFDMAGRFLVARASILTITLPLAFSLDDAAASYTASMPSRLLRRRSHSLAIMGVAWAMALVAVLLLVNGGLVSSPDNPFPFVRLITEAIALAAITLGFAAALGRHRAEPGRSAMGLLIVIAIGIVAIPPPLQPWMTPFDPQHTGIGLGAWSIVAIVAFAIFLTLSRDSRTQS